ncbi:hypothetical protein Syun_000220 [Stephania yunnanensis]|uniref:BHLH domain-containing protein n=1 Tax=Stephania yunnanensis TaxID=152371 RepID=A0AAP0LCN1_9MAGN
MQNNHYYSSSAPSGAPHHVVDNFINNNNKAVVMTSSSSSSSTSKGVKLSTDPQSVAARQRRHRISDRFKILQSMVPGGTRMDTVSMLDKAIHYVKFLKTQIWLHQAIINSNDTTNFVKDGLNPHQQMLISDHVNTTTTSTNVPDQLYDLSNLEVSSLAHHQPYCYHGDRVELSSESNEIN